MGHKRIDRAAPPLQLAQAELAQSRRALEQANADLEALAYGISHDVRSPLSTLAGLLKILDEDHAAELSGDGREVLALAAGAVDRVSRTVAGVVEFALASTTTSEFAVVELDGILAKLVAGLRADIVSKGARVQVASLPSIQSNASALTHVFSSLLSNALKFTVEPPAVPVIKVGAEEGDEGWTFFLRDNGPGIDLANREELFKPFVRLHRKADVPGAGLGLATCRRCVELHGGRIWIDEAYDGGTQVNVFIPATQGP